MIVTYAEGPTIEHLITGNPRGKNYPGHAPGKAVRGCPMCASTGRLDSKPAGGAMVEKMARAVYPEVARAADFDAIGFERFDAALASGGRLGDPWVEASFRIARAALLAIRDIDPDIASRTVAAAQDVRPSALDAEDVAAQWRTAIDAILNEKT